MACKKAEYRAARGDDRTRFRTGYPPENKTRGRTIQEVALSEQLKDSSARDRGKRKDAGAVTHIHIYTRKKGREEMQKIASVDGRARFRSSARKGHSEHIGKFL